MKRIFFALLSILCISYNVFSQEQAQSIGTIKGATKIQGRVYIDSAFFLPVKTTGWSPLRFGAVAYDSTTNKIILWNGIAWGEALSGLDTTAADLRYIRIQRTLDSLSALQSRLQTKEPLLGFTPVPNTRTINGYPLTGNITLNKSDVGLGNVDNTSDANKPISTATQTALDGKQNSLGYTPENQANKATDFTTVNNTLYPTVQAVKTYADALVVGLVDDRGNHNASSNTYPSTNGSGSGGAILKGDLYFISGAGVLNGDSVFVGDQLRALVDAPGSTASNWALMRGKVPFTPENVSNKSTSTSLGTSNTLYPSQNAVKAYVDNKTANSANWDIAYNKRPSSASISASTFTLTLGDGSTVTASIPTFNQNTTGNAATANNATLWNSQEFVNTTISTAPTDLIGTNSATGKFTRINLNGLAAMLDTTTMLSKYPLTNGTRATGTWNISVTGTAASETLATVTGRGATTSTAVTFNGGITSTSGIFSGDITANSRLLLTASTSPTVQGQIGYNSTVGLYLYPKAGSSFDFNLYNSTGATVMYVPAGTLNASFGGVVSLGSTISASSSAGKIVQIRNTLLEDNTNGYGIIRYNGYFDGTNDKYIYTGTASAFQLSGNVFKWYQAASGTAGNNISFVNTMTLEASGNLGIGTTSPASNYRLTLNGDASTVAAGFVARANGTDVLYVGNIAASNTTDVEFWNPRNGYIRFGANNTEYGRLTSGGFWLFGTATSNGVDRMQIAGGVLINSNTGGLRFNRTATSNYTGYYLSSNDASKWFVGLRESPADDNYRIYNNVTGSDAVTINISTNAASFISSVTGTILTGNSYVTGGYLQASGATGLLVLTSASWAANSEVRNNTDINGSSGGDYMSFKNPSGKGFTWTVNGTTISNLSNAGTFTAKGFIHAYRSVSSSTTLTAEDYYIKVTASCTITLPTAVGRAGQRYVIRATGGTTSFATTSSQTINGFSAGSFTLVGENQAMIVVFSDGANWITEYYNCGC